MPPLINWRSVLPHNRYIRWGFEIVCKEILKVNIEFDFYSGLKFISKTKKIRVLVLSQTWNILILTGPEIHTKQDQPL